MIIPSLQIVAAWKGREAAPGQAFAACNSYISCSWRRTSSAPLLTGAADIGNGQSASGDASTVKDNPNLFCGERAKCVTVQCDTVLGELLFALNSDEVRPGAPSRPDRYVRRPTGAHHRTWRRHGGRGAQQAAVGTPSRGGKANLCRLLRACGGPAVHRRPGRGAPDRLQCNAEGQRANRRVDVLILN